MNVRALLGCGAALLLLCNGGCGRGKPSTSGARAAGLVAPGGRAPDDGSEEGIPGRVDVFRAWDELPPEARSQAARSLFLTHLVLRVRVHVGCAAARPEDRPRSGHLWGDFADACVAGKGRTHPLRALNGDSVLVTTSWAPGGTDELSLPVLSVTESAVDGIRIGLAPPVVARCDVPVEDTHWLVLPSGPVSVSFSEGSDRCDVATP